MNAILRHSLLSIAIASSLAVLAPRTAAAQELNGFGQKGQLIVSVDRLVPLVGFTRFSVDTSQNGVSTTESETSSSISLLFGREANSESPTFPSVDPNTIPRVAFDYTVIPHLTVGGAVVVGLGLGGSHKTQASQNGQTTETTIDAPTVTAFGIAARAGYVLPLGTSNFGFWPRAGFSFYSLSTKITTTDANNTNQDVETKGTDTAFSLDLDPQFVWVPVPHFFINGGPVINIPLAGTVSTTTTSGGTEVETSNDLHIFHIGLSLGMGGWFDL